MSRHSKECVLPHAHRMATLRCHRSTQTLIEHRKPLQLTTAYCHRVALSISTLADHTAQRTPCCGHVRTPPSRAVVLLQVTAWSQHTSSGLTEVWLDNQGHNYIADCPQGLTAMLRMQLGPASLASQHPVPAAAPERAAAAPGSKAQSTQAGAAETTSDDKELPLWRRCCCAP
jgi:hypothetical protein